MVYKGIFIIFLGFLALSSSAQVQDSARIIEDTVKSDHDSLVLVGNSLFVVSKDSIKDPVLYSADDRVNFDYVNKVIHLYTNAMIKYQTMEITAAYIKIDMKTSIATAIPNTDSLGKKIGVPKFKDGEQNFNAQKLDYNFKTKKGIISGVVSKEDDIYIHGQKTKFISKDNPEAEGEDVIYNQNAIFTTCDHPDPHFGIYSKKQKIIPNKLVVVGPSTLIIKGIPAFALPFGFFPLSKERQAGLIFPRNYSYQDGLGFGLEDVGYYIPINQYMDLRVLTNFYSKGSWGIKNIGSYKKKYKFNGNFLLDFNNRIEDRQGLANKVISRPVKIEWSHNQAQSAHPYQNFGGSINIQTNAYNRRIDINPNQVLNNTLRSNLTYTRVFPRTPFTLNANFNHDQNNITKIMNLTLPSLNLNMRSINPFKNNHRISKDEKWYDRITLNYNSQFSNRVTTTDSTLFTKKTLDDMNFGVKHAAGVDVSFRVLKYFNLTPSIDYNEEWFFNKQDKRFDPRIHIDSTKYKIGEKDTTRYDTTYGRVYTDYQRGFAAFREMSGSMSLNTRIYSQVRSRKGWFRGLRHEASPTVNFSYAPNYHKSPFNYFKSVHTDTSFDASKKLEYLVFAKSPFGTSSVNAENFQANFGISNRIELKYKNRKDSIAKKLVLIEGLSVNGNYNFFADSFKLSNISVGGNNRFIKGIMTVNYNFTFDPYKREIKDNIEKRIDDYSLQSGARLAYLTSANLSIYNGTSIAQLRDLLFKKNKDAPKSNVESLPSFYEVISGFNLSHNISFNLTRLRSGKDTLSINNNSLSLNGSIPLTSKWTVRLDNIAYDFQAPKGNRIIYPSLGIERDLHCWYMKMNWTPDRGYYSFFIGVKPGSFEFINIPNSRVFTGSSPY